jgi:hypothetical protein
MSPLDHKRAVEYLPAQEARCSRQRAFFPDRRAAPSAASVSMD